MKKLFIIISFMFAITGCSTPQPTLQEKLEGKTITERTEIVRKECFNIAGRLKAGPNSAHTKIPARKLSEVCAAIPHK